MPLKAVLFDMDGVIVDTEPLHRKAFYKTFEDLNIIVSDEYYATFTGASTKKVTNSLKEKYKLDISAEDITNIKRRYFKHFFDTDPNFNLHIGVRELIETYYRNNIKLVLASSASMNTINWVFDKFNIGKYFMGKISGADLEESKPNPEIFIKAAEIAGEAPKNCMVIEDSTNGILAANRAGIFCAAYKNENSLMQNYQLANILVDDFSELEPEKISIFFK